MSTLAFGHGARLCRFPEALAFRARDSGAELELLRLVSCHGIGKETAK